MGGKGSPELDGQDAVVPRAGDELDIIILRPGSQASIRTHSRSLPRQPAPCGHPLQLSSPPCPPPSHPTSGILHQLCVVNAVQGMLQEALLQEARTRKCVAAFSSASTQERA